MVVKRVLTFTEKELCTTDSLRRREWIVTNGLGGYASGTISGVITRRYHGYLIAALPNPYGRTVMLNSLVESIQFPDSKPIQLTAEEHADGPKTPRGVGHLLDFCLELGLPVWRYHINDTTMEKRVFLRYRQNTVQLSYKINEGGPATLLLRPCVHFHPQNQELTAGLTPSYTTTFKENIMSIASPPQPFHLTIELACTANNHFISEPTVIREMVYREEADRGYPYRQDLWSPGYYQVSLEQDKSCFMIASTEPQEVVTALSADEAVTAELGRRRLRTGLALKKTQDQIGSELVLAADQFIIAPVARSLDAVRIHARGDEMRSVIAGYHWFTDWGRDTMISLEGLTLLTGRFTEARWILRTFASYIADGLIPNMFPEGEEQARYNTADATLWFFHALYRYLKYTRDRTTLLLLLPQLIQIVDRHLTGTRFGIGIDLEDGLLMQGTPEYPLTWMDAQVDDWVVTPRRGKAVEINALWYNALRHLEVWCKEEGLTDLSKRYGIWAVRAKESFNRRFWYQEGGYLYDVVDGENGDDPSCRPNQVLAISLTYPVLVRSRWESVMRVVEEQLVTPFGLRSLAPSDARYKAQYFGDVRSRDAAYHQGTVWPWLLGPFVDAFLRVFPQRRAQARSFLEGIIPSMNDAGLGSISEIFDASAPFAPRGCVSQAWSVAEVLRCWVLTST
jgi:predicted glycogen debranching enzyme